MEIRGTDGGYLYIRPQEEEKSMEEYGDCLRTLRENFLKEEDAKYLAFAKGMKVLIVEDNIAWQKLIATYLKTLEIRSISMRTGEEAVNYMKENTCDLILMDQIMPDMEGTEIAQKIRKNLSDKGEFPPIVMMVSYEMPDLQEILQENSILDYMIKPVDVKQIRRVILNCKKEAEQ